MSNKQRLDVYLTEIGLVPTRSQAESWIRLGRVSVNGRVETKPGHFVDSGANVKLSASEQYVSRAGLKLASVSVALKLDFKDKVVLDVGSSTGGFTDYALQHGAKKVIAVDVGTDQLHPSLRKNSRVELHEKTDIRSVAVQGDTLSASFLRLAPFAMNSSLHSTGNVESSERSDIVSPKIPKDSVVAISETPDIIVIDVSFISLREILPHIAENIAGSNTQIVAMVKPQFEAGKNMTSNGVIKNDSVRRKVLKDFELWAKRYFLVVDKADSEVAGAHGNRERFYLLKPVTKR